MVTLAEIYDWFMTGKKPTQAQFWASWGSFWNKGEQIPQSAVSNLTTVLNAKAEKAQFDAHKTDENAHAAILVEPNERITALEAKTDSENNFKIIPNPPFSLNPATRVLTMNAGWEGVINGEDYTNVAAQELVPAVPLAAAGYSRIDLIVFNTDSLFVRVQGEPSLTTPGAPPLPPNTIEATFLTVSDGVVDAPVTPKPKAPVTSVQGMRGDVILKVINDLVTGGITDFLSAEQGKVLKTQINAINTLLTSDNVNLDNVQELVDAIETIQTSLSTILVNDLTTGGTTKALTAEMGKTLKALIDSLTTVASGKEPAITGGAAGQYYDYNKTWQTIPVVDISGKQDIANQVEVTASQDAQVSWHGKTVFFMANVTITIPASGLPSGFTFEGVTEPSCSVTWAITSPKTWVLGAPAATPEKSIFTLMQLMTNSNKIYLFGL